MQLWLDLVRVPPAGTWELPRAHVYGLADGGSARGWRWSARRPRSCSCGATWAASARRRRRTWPGTRAGTSPRPRRCWRRLDLREDRDPDGAKLVDLPDAARPDGDAPAPVRFLSTFDALLLLGHAKRARIVPEEHREKVFATKMPQSIPTFLVDGHVAGTWRYLDGRVAPTPFTPLSRGSRRAVDEEAERLTAFHRDG